MRKLFKKEIGKLQAKIQERKLFIEIMHDDQWRRQYLSSLDFDLGAEFANDIFIGVYYRDIDKILKKHYKVLREYELRRRK